MNKEQLKAAIYAALNEWMREADAMVRAQSEAVRNAAGRRRDAAQDKLDPLIDALANLGS